MLKLIWTVYNQAVLNTITDIILKIKKAANLNKINLHEEVKANIRIIIKKSEQSNFHRKEVELMTKEQEKYKKESETIIYCKHNNHFDNKEGIYHESFLILQSTNEKLTMRIWMRFMSALKRTL